MLEIELDTTYINKVTINFEDRMSLTSMSIIQVFTPVSTANFDVVDISIPFFLCLKIWIHLVFV